MASFCHRKMRCHLPLHSSARCSIQQPCPTTRNTLYRPWFATQTHSTENKHVIGLLHSRAASYRDAEPAGSGSLPSAADMHCQQGRAQLATIRGMHEELSSAGLQVLLLSDSTIESSSALRNVYDLDAVDHLQDVPSNTFDVVLFCAERQRMTLQLLTEVLQKITPGGRILVPTAGDSSAALRQLLFEAGFCDIVDDAEGRRMASPSGRHAELSFPAIMAQRPGTKQGLEAAAAAEGLGYVSRSAIALGDLGRRPPETVTEHVRARWHGAYEELCEEATTLGIPQTAIPAVSQDSSLDELQAARTRLSGMIASFLSANI